MTVQETEGKVAQTLAFVSRLTVYGLKEILPVHGNTLQLLRWHRLGFCKILPKCVAALESLQYAINSIANDPRLYLREKVQQTIEWEGILP